MTLIEAMRSLGRPDQLRELVARAAAPAVRRANAHVHLPPNFSAFASVDDALGRAGDEGLRLLGASNYYHYGVYEPFAAGCLDRGIFPLAGLEIISQLEPLRQAGVKINDPGNPGRMYLCGKATLGVSDPSPGAAELLATIRDNDSLRMQQMLQRLTEHFSQLGLRIHLDAQTVIEGVASRVGCPRDWVFLQERHLAQAIQEAVFHCAARAPAPPEVVEYLAAGDSVAAQNLLRSRLMKAGRPAFVPERFLDFSEARELVCRLGGVPCYPVLADGAEPVCPYEQAPDALVDRLSQAGIHCCEFIPIRNRPETLRHYVLAVRQAGLIVTAGTEHNTPAMLPMVPTTLGGQAIDDDLSAIFWEGSCVLAAHQFLTAWGECGYVDDAGALNPAYSNQEQRIADLAALGAAVIDKVAR